MPVFRRTLLAAATLALATGFLSTPGPAQAQSPGTVRLLVGYAPGGPVDTAARQFAPHFARELGQSVLVENKPGANATLAGDIVAKAEPDGRTLWFSASPPVTISPHIMKKMAFDPAKDLTALAPLVVYDNVLVVHPEVPAKTLQELIAYAKANPGKLSYGSAGVGGSNHLSGELMAQRTGTQLNHVPYKGSAPAMNDVIGGQIQMMFDIVNTARGYIGAGRVRPIAIASAKRNAAIPDVPTFAEAGLPNFEVGGWFALFGPPKMAPALSSKLHEAAMKALASPELKKAYGDAGFEIWQGSGEALATRLVQERAMWGPVTKGIQVD